MINSTFKNPKGTIRYLVVIASISIICFLTYYFEIIIKTHIIYSHLFYFPIILACFWWKKKGLIVPLFLSGILIIFSFLGDGTVNDMIEAFTRSVIFLVVGTIISILSQKISKNEQELKKSEEKYRYVFNNAKVGLFWSRISDGKFLECNDTFAKLVGYDTREECLADYIALEHYVDLNTRNEMLEEIRINNEIKDFEIHVTKRDGTPYWASISARTDLKENRIEGAAIDITTRKKAEQLLQEKIEELARINAELEQFTYVASHDLKEPLRMISSFAQLLEKRYKDKLDEDANDFISFITEGVVRMQDLIKNLLDYSKIGKNHKEFERVDLNDVLKDGIDNLRQIINETNAEIIYDSLPIIYGDKYQLIQVFQNLISNAIKFRGIDSPLISISAKPDGKHWVFSISDNGIGIDSKDFERIFIIFQRLHRTEKYEGTGIGLAICKKIVEYHRGKIWVESEVGKGSTFYFSIPKETYIKS